MKPQARSLPNPTPFEDPFKSEEVMLENRDPFCPGYNTCLTVAVQRDWENWTCTQCRFFGNSADLPKVGDHAHSRRSDPFTT